jgi:hypothetical protein
LNGEGVYDSDSVFWWVGHLSHEWKAGVDDEGLLWHATGPLVYVGWAN